MKRMSQTFILCSIPKITDAVEHLFIPEVKKDKIDYSSRVLVSDYDVPEHEIISLRSQVVYLKTELKRHQSSVLTPGFDINNEQGETELEFTQRLLHTARTTIAAFVKEVDQPKKEVLIADPTLPSIRPLPVNILGIPNKPKKKDIGSAPLDINFDNYTGSAPYEIKEKITPTIKKRIARKKRDTTPTFRAHYDRTKVEYAKWIEEWKDLSPHHRPNMELLMIKLNALFNMDKAYTFYCTIWNDKNEENIIHFPHADHKFPFED